MFTNLEDLRKENEVLDIFCSLASIPSPSLKEEKVSAWILEFCEKNNINAKLDAYGNVYIHVPATDLSKEPIMLSSHMDVVGDDAPIEIYLDEEGFIHAKGRTLGADDKVGVACALMLAKEIANCSASEPSLLHGGLEITFTRDEETGMSGIEHVEFDKILSKYVLVCDADKLGQLQISGASYTNAKIIVHGLKGGHSGIDISDETRLNAAKLTAELLAEFPQGVFYKDETGVITSCNLGAIVAGGIQNSVASIVEKGIKTNDYITEIMKKTSTNIINVLGMASYSIRSASLAKEEELKTLMSNIVEKFNKKYEGLAEAKIDFEVHLLPFEKAEDDRIEKVHTQACQMAGIENDISSFHAGAETHIYCHNKNSKGETFMPMLLGLADVYNMHSASEKVDYKTLLKGYEVIKNTFLIFNK
ncbi:M20/M25/M40 family metallo-hydrolase [bacterium]|nr:M20/M25/M40 family metallo-hydrolase [bacterium]MBR1776128.1 M20/M25/M40 family metallo-hydrolase [bacterium]